MIARDDQNAFDLLFMRYKQKMLVKAANAPQIGLDSDDFMQECAVSLMDAVKGYNPDTGTSFSTYVNSCMDNRIASAVRKANADKRRALRDYTELDEIYIATSVDDPAVRMQAKEMADELKSSINENLSPTEKSVFERHFLGESYASIGEELGISIRSVDNAIQRVRKKLRKLDL